MPETLTQLEHEALTETQLEASLEAGSEAQTEAQLEVCPEAEPQPEPQAQQTQQGVKLAGKGPEPAQPLQPRELRLASLWHPTPPSSGLAGSCWRCPLPLALGLQPAGRQH